jgi:hypothetical protein
VSESEEIGRKLDLLIALTRVGVRDQLERERRRLEEDRVSAAILLNSQDWISAGELKDAVARTTRQSEATVKRRVAELVARGALLKRGATRTMSYRSSGLFDV